MDVNLFFVSVDLVWVSTLVGVLQWPSILLSGKQPVSMLAWLLGVTFLPVAGPLLFFLVGQNRIKRGLLRKKLTARQSLGPRLPPLEQESWLALEGYREAAPDMQDLLRLQGRVGGTPLTTGNRVELLRGAVEKYPRLFADIQQAQDHINLEYYILQEDETGNRIADLLLEKSRQGIKVNLILDTVGTFWLSYRFIDRLRGGGVQITWFHPINPLNTLKRVLRFNRPKKSRRIRFSPRWNLNLRNHRKIVVIDGRIGYVGGLNLGDEYLGGKHGFDNWEDLAVRLEGPSVKTLQRIFMEDWRFSSRLPLRGGEYFPTSNAVPADTRGIVQVVPSGPDEDHGVLGRIYFGALCAARTRAWLMTPYFLPDESFQAALINAALKGVDVRVIIPHRSDNSLVDLASRSFFVPLIEAGVKIFLFHQGMLHAKALLVDDDWSAVGTANMDVRSLRLSFEAGALIHNRQVAHSLEGFCAAQMGQSTQVTLAEATSRRWYARAAQSLARLFSPVL